jgi:hypothetical protein
MNIQQGYVDDLILSNSPRLAAGLLIKIRKDLGLDDGLEAENIVYLTDAKNPKPTPKNPNATAQPNDNKD